MELVMFLALIGGEIWLLSLLFLQLASLLELWLSQLESLAVLSGTVGGTIGSTVGGTVGGSSTTLVLIFLGAVRVHWWEGANLL